MQTWVQLEPSGQTGRV